MDRGTDEAARVAQRQVLSGWSVRITGPSGRALLEITLCDPEDLALVRRWLERVEVEARPVPTVWSVPKSAPCPGCGSTAKGLHVRGCGDAGLIQPDAGPDPELLTPAELERGRAAMRRRGADPLERP